MHVFNNKLNKKYVLYLEKFLDMLNDDTQFTNNNPSYKAYKLNSL